MEYVNNNLDNNAKILTMDPRGYYFDKSYITAKTIRKTIKDVAKLLDNLKENQVTHLFCNENASNTGYSPLPEELRQYIKPEYSTDNVYLYRFGWYSPVFSQRK